MKTKKFIAKPREKEEITSLLGILLMDFVHEVRELVECGYLSKSKRINLINQNVEKILSMLSPNLIFKK